MSSKYILSNGLYLPAVEDIYMVIDDAGVSNTDFLGFTALMIDEFTFRNIEKKVRDYCLQNRIINLHARNLEIEGIEDGQLEMDEYERIYRNLFDIVIPEFEKANYIYLINLLTNQKFIQNIYSDHHNLFNKITTNLVDSSFPTLYSNYYSFFAFPTIGIIKRIKNCNKDISIKVIIDKKDEFESISNHTVYLKGSIANVTYKLNEVAVIVFNAYTKYTINNNCKISNLSVTTSKDNPLINVVDGFCNFSYNYAKVIIQGVTNSSHTEMRKYNIFRNILIQNIGMNLAQIEEREILIRDNFQFISGKIISTNNKEVSTFELLH